MNQVAQDYNVMCSVGYSCGLITVSEAYNQIYRHYDAFFLIEEAGARLAALDQYITDLDVWEKTIQEARGHLWCVEQDYLSLGENNQ